MCLRPSLVNEMRERLNAGESHTGNEKRPTGWKKGRRSFLLYLTDLEGSFLRIIKTKTPVLTGLRVASSALSHYCDIILHRSGACPPSFSILSLNKHHSHGNTTTRHHQQGCCARSTTVTDTIERRREPCCGVATVRISFGAFQLGSPPIVFLSIVVVLSAWYETRREARQNLQSYNLHATSVSHEQTWYLTTEKQRRRTKTLRFPNGQDRVLPFSDLEPSGVKLPKCWPITVFQDRTVNIEKDLLAPQLTSHIKATPKFPFGFVTSNKYK